MILVHVLHRALLGFQQPRGVADIGEELAWLEVNDAAKAGNQMGIGRHDPKEREILKFYKGFCGWMGVEVAPAQDSGLIGISLLGPSSQHDPCALQRIASRALVQHQRYPVIAEDVLRMQRQP